MPTPSYQTMVAPIVAHRCLICHSAGGAAADRPFDTYARLFAERSTGLNFVYNCYMPPAGAVKPTPAERAQLLAWFVCGAPNN